MHGSLIHKAQLREELRLVWLKRNSTLAVNALQRRPTAEAIVPEDPCQQRAHHHAWGMSNEAQQHRS